MQQPEEEQAELLQSLKGVANNYTDIKSHSDGVSARWWNLGWGQHINRSALARVRVVADCSCQAASRRSMPTRLHQG